MPAVERKPVGDAANSIGGNAVKDLADDLRALAAPIERHEKMPDAIKRAAKACGLHYWRVWNVWYDKARSVTGDEIAVVAAALERKRRADARAELADLWSRLTVLEARLAIGDADFHRPDIDAAREQRRKF